MVELEETLRIPSGYQLQGGEKLGQDGNRLQLKTSLRLKKRVYEASDWDSFRKAVNAAKKCGEYIVLKK